MNKRRIKGSVRRAGREKLTGDMKWGMTPLLKGGNGGLSRPSGERTVENNAGLVKALSKKKGGKEEGKSRHREQDMIY